jgi:hypothetical protein
MGLVAIKETAVERVKQAHENAIRMMRKSGFEVDNIMEVAVDPQLPFMGYTTPQGGGFRIVVSGMAVESGMLEGLLVHEMSHVYRMQTNHPSHNQRIIEEAVNGLGERALSRDYQRKIIRELVNNIQDLYADDIAMKVFREGRFVSQEQLTSFLQDWVKNEPVKSNDQRKDRWVNVGIMVNNARALGQMRRHRITDTGGKAKASNEKLLNRMPPAASNQFPHFMNLMANLKEGITEADYRQLLTDYLNEFIEIAENS